MTPTATGKNSQEDGQEEDRQLSAVWSILILQGRAPVHSPVSLPSVVSYFWHFWLPEAQPLGAATLLCWYES